MALIRRSGWALAMAAIAGLALPWPAAAAEPSWGEAEVSTTFGSAIEFIQPVTLETAPVRVELLVGTPGALGPEVVEVPAPAGGGRVVLEYSYGIGGAALPPNTVIEARWRVTDRVGRTYLGPLATVRYSDDRFRWRTVSGSLVNVHWYEGDTAFGRRALAIGEDAVRSAGSFLGVTESEPVDFFVYASRDDFYAALGPDRENVGGYALVEVRTMFARIEPAEIDQPWVGTVIPHELTHLVFDTAVDNPYHQPPHWLDEGVAVYLSVAYGPADRAAVGTAVEEGSLIPLDGLVGQFPTTAERFGLAYSESVSAVDFLVRRFGKDALVALIRSYTTGVTDDEAFTAALGIGTGQFNEAWLDDLGAAVPTAFGPQPAPLGPLPDGWTGPGGGPGPSLPPNPAPGPTEPLGATPAPSTGGTEAGGGPSSGDLALILGIVAMVLAIAGGLQVRAARRRDRGRGTGQRDVA
jgi:hypothetical protein